MAQNQEILIRSYQREDRDGVVALWRVGFAGAPPRAMSLMASSRGSSWPQMGSFLSLSKRIGSWVRSWLASTVSEVGSTTWPWCRIFDVRDWRVVSWITPKNDFSIEVV
jgi:hypothetical protein